MEKVYLGSKAILLFLVIVLVCQTLFGDKVTQKMIILILFSMLVLNSDKVTNFLTTITSNLTANTTLNNSTVHYSSSEKLHGGTGGGF